MRQLLQSWLGDIAGIREIDNQVDVVNSAGLSSVRPR
jgi:hypothetical protein